MHSLELTKPDGRSLTLYSSQPIAAGIAAPSPFAEPQLANPHLRWHPLRGDSRLHYPAGTPLLVLYSKCSASPGKTRGWMACAAIAASEKPCRISFSLPG